MKVACIGAGTIGRSWALLFALRGYEVTLHDISDDILNDAVGMIRTYLSMLCEEEVIGRESANKVMERIKTSTSIRRAVTGAGYVQESVFEDLNLKKGVFKEVDEYVAPDAILASSTSGLPMSKIQSELKHPDRCIIVHPINPPHLIPLVEIVPGWKTSVETINRTVELMFKLGKVPVVIKKEIPGFIFNRLAAALWREALNILNNDVATVEDVDKVVTAGLGLRWAIMGPFLTYHIGGGKGGLKYFIDHLGKAFSEWWKTMEAWTVIPDSAVKKAIAETGELSIIKDKTIDEVLEWRDRRLVKILKLLYPQSISF
ncbi:MAG: 3-hydroxyacyl-CoA dehydrogenase NAD-binding domain-containing protein [Candidatus Bathyarchaeia archaeon]